MSKALLMVRKNNNTVLKFYEDMGYGDDDVVVVGKWLQEKESNNGLLRLVICTHDKQWQAAKTYRQKYFFDNVSMDDPYTWTFDHKDHQHFVLYNDTDIIGYAHIQLWPENRAVMRIIVVDEDHRKSGFGKWFVEKIEEWLKEKGFSSLQAESSPAALNFYTALGYTPMPFDYPDGYEGGADDVPVGKKL